MRRPRKNNANKKLLQFLQSRGGMLRIDSPLIERRRTFGYICAEIPSSRRCIFINKKSSLNDIVSVGERVVNMSIKQQMPIIIGLEEHYYKVNGVDIVNAGGYKNNFKNTIMFNFSLHKARAWDVTTMGKFFPLVADENQLTIES